MSVVKLSDVTKLLPKLFSPKPPPAVVCFFEASVLFGIKNAIFCLSLWAIFVILSRMYACFGVGLQAYIIQWGYILDHVNSVNHVNNVNHVNRVRGHAACQLFWAFAKMFSFLTLRTMSGEKGVRCRILARKEALCLVSCFAHI